MVSGHDVLQTNATRRQRQVVEELLVDLCRRRSLPRFVIQDEDREGLLFAARVDAQKHPDEVDLVLVVDEEQPSGDESFDCERMTQKKAPDPILDLKIDLGQLVVLLQVLAGPLRHREVLELVLELPDPLLVLALLLLRVLLREGPLHHVLYPQLFHSKLERQKLRLS